MTTSDLARTGPDQRLHLHRHWSTAAVLVVVLGLLVASLYGLLAPRPYRGIPHETVLAARAQDACSLVVAVLLLLGVRRDGSVTHLLRLGLMAYVLYSYAIYLTGLPMNRAFLVYVVLETAAATVFLDGLLRLRPEIRGRISTTRLDRVTGWLLVAVAALFAALWLSVLLPFALGGPAPSPSGPGGVPFPVFVLDLAVELPCIAAVGVLLLRRHPMAAPLAVVALAKIVTLFTALWAGVLAGLVIDGHVHLGADAAPSLLLLVAGVVLLLRWIRDERVRHTHLHPTVWAT